MKCAYCGHGIRRERLFETEWTHTDGPEPRGLYCIVSGDPDPDWWITANKAEPEFSQARLI